MTKRLLFFVLLISPLLMANEPVSTSFWTNIAIGGHDSLGYYQPGLSNSEATIKGSPKYKVVWQGAHWQFASQESADKFAQNPKKYAPRYNGHCANALSLDLGLINTDGSVWEFFGDRLHLFYAERGRLRWLEGDWQAFQADADKAWLKALKEAED